MWKQNNSFCAQNSFTPLESRALNNFWLTVPHSLTWNTFHNEQFLHVKSLNHFRQFHNSKHAINHSRLYRLNKLDTEMSATDFFDLNEPSNRSDFGRVIWRRKMDPSLSACSSFSNSVERKLIVANSVDSMRKQFESVKFEKVSHI